jgi:hypothetical protein
MNIQRIFPKIDNVDNHVQGSKKYLDDAAKKGSSYAEYINKFIPNKITSEYQQSKINSVAPRIKLIENAIPIMISELGEIVCIPRTKDPPVISFLGARQGGKSLSSLGYFSRLFKYTGDPCIIMNDFQYASQDYVSPQNNPDFIKQLWLCGETPTGLPITQLYPVSSKFQEPKDATLKVDILKICLSFKKVIENHEDFLVLKEGSSKHLNTMKDDIIEEGYKTKSLDKIEELIAYKLKNEINVSQSEAANNIKRAIIGSIGSMWKEKLFDISNENALTNIKIKKEDSEITMSAILGLMYVGLVPALATGNIRKSRWFDSYFNSILEEIYYTQIEDSWFKRNNKVVHILIDEAQALIHNFEKTKKTIELMATEGRNARIALYWVAQNYKYVPADITGQTNYSICMQQKQEKDIATIKKEFELTKQDVGEILNLNKTNHECVALTTDNFIVYDVENNRIYKTEENIKGRFLPPLCKTVPPQWSLEE